MSVLKHPEWVLKRLKQAVLEVAGPGDFNVVWTELDFEHPRLVFHSKDHKKEMFAVLPEVVNYISFHYGGGVRYWQAIMNDGVTHRHGKAARIMDLQIHAFEEAFQEMKANEKAPAPIDPIVVGAGDW